MPLTPHQKSIALIMWARGLGYVGLAFFALALTSLLGWKRVVPYQLAVGVAGCTASFALSLWILRFLPNSPAKTDERGDSE